MNCGSAKKIGIQPRILLSTKMMVQITNAHILATSTLFSLATSYILNQPPHLLSILAVVILGFRRSNNVIAEVFFEYDDDPSVPKPQELSIDETTEVSDEEMEDAQEDAQEESQEDAQEDAQEESQEDAQEEKTS